MIRSVPILLAALLLALPVTARADAPSAADIAVARRLFNEASALEKDKKWSDAEAKLREAIAIKETPGLHYHIGFCVEQQGKLVEALVEYDRAVELLEHGAKAPDVAELVGPARDSVRKRLAHVRVVLPSDVSNPSVAIDGAPVKAALLEEPLPQNPGHHVLTVSAPGRQAFRQEIALSESESQDVTVDLPALAGGHTKAAAKAAPAQEGPSQDRGTAASTKGFPTRTAVLIGEGVVTVAGLATGVGFSISKGKETDKIGQAKADLDGLGYSSDSVCADTKSAPQRVKDDCGFISDHVDLRQRDATFATIGFVGAGVGAAAMVATFFLWKPESAQNSAISFTPVLGPGRVGLGAAGRF